MEKNCKKFNGFSVIDMVAILMACAIIIIIASRFLAENPAKEGWDDAAKNATNDIVKASNEIIKYNATTNDFSRLKLGSTSFSIKNRNCKTNMVRLYQRYLSNVNYGIDLNNAYFNNPIINYEKKPLDSLLKNNFSDFVYILDGVIVGFKFYGTCNATEKFANPALHRQPYSASNVCGSIFFDVNGYKEPNKLG